MNGAVVKKTQDTLGKVIKKPPLTDKLLGKPPFRYLHDIFSEVIRTTGFMKGLYVENDMKSDNVKEKDSKIAFLQKAIDVVMLVSGESLAVKPARIVAGHEPERTNELLQAIAKCCLSKMSSEDAVRRVLAGEKVDPKSKASTSSSRSQDKENREGRERQPDREEKREILERSGSQEHKDPEQPKEPEVRQDTRERQRTRERRGKERDKEKEKEPHKEKEKEPHKEKEKEPHKEKEKDRERDKDKERHREKDRGRENDREKEREREKDPERAKDRDKTRDRDSHREKERDRRRERDKERERPKEGEERGKALERGDRKTKVPEDQKPKSHPEEPSRAAKTAPAEEDAPESESLARIPRPSSAKGQRRRPKVTGQDESDSEGEGEAAAAAAERAGAPQENGDTSDPQANTTPSSRQIPRPSSARPAPPRVKRQDGHPDVPPPERLASAKPPAAVIMEGKKQSEDEEDEDEQFLVEEAALLLPEMPDLEVANAVELNGDEKHGGLVKKILETKKDYESSSSSPKSKEQGPVSDAAQRKARDLVGREMERLRGSVQTVCRSALPLGKIMDYIQEDMDSMQAELLAWRRENLQHAAALQEEQRTTDRSVEPLQKELVELDQLIRDQQDKICAVKSNILRNEEKIHKMTGERSPPRSVDNIKILF
uniref:TRAF3-interacting protein 1 n=1 Tax=Gadus morhua TaxID=8049 RepID=A0A8C5A9S2_GADMO